MTQLPPEGGDEQAVTVAQGRSGRAVDGLERIQDLCRAALERRTVRHIAYYIRGNQQFWQDTFESPELPALSGDVARRRASLNVSGQQLNYVVARLDKAFEPVRSGRLIRCVFDAGEGALLYYSPFPGEYLVGASLDEDPPVDEADATMVRLCDQVRLARGYGGSQNEGGLATEYEVTSDPAYLVSEEEYLDVIVRGEARPRLESHFRAVLTPEVLHYVTYFEGGEPVLSADLLRHPRLASLTLGLEHARRRKYYEHIGKLTYITGHRMDRTLLPLLGGVLRRVVLDVEAGALYYRRLGRDDALIGITLDQAKVAVAESSMRTLAQAVADR